MLQYLREIIKQNKNCNNRNENALERERKKERRGESKIVKLK